MTGPVFLQALMMMFGTFAFLGSLRFLRRLLELKHEQRTPMAIEGIQERLDRIESVVEATAIEVERMSEANRFMAKLLAERSEAAKFPARPERVITPH